MNTEEIRTIIQGRFPRIEGLGEHVFKSYSFHAGKPFARWVFDCTETITRKDLDIRAYQAELLRDEFYRQAGSMQWNLYCYFLCDEEAFNDLRSRGIVETVERDRAYARKFVRTPAMLKEDLSSLERIAAETTSDIPIDVGSLLQNTLAKQGLSAVFSELAYAEVVRLITAGQDAPDIGGEERKPGSDAVPRIEFIDALDLGGFRHRPRIPMFEFGCCNLIYGVNGSGKTSLLEGIELWMCGRHRRNPDASIEPGCVKLRIRGVSDWQPGPDSSIATYRERDHVWYGNYQARRNDLCFSFARFNFYDTDAAARLEISADDKEIESALPRLVLGETATRISERINRLLPTLKSEERECSTQVRNAEEAIRSARETIDSLEKPTESARQAYERMCAQLSLLGRRGAPPADSSDGCLGLLDFINEVATNIEAIASEITWIQTVSPAALEKDKQSLQTCCAALAEISGRVGTLDREKREVVATVENYEKQLKLLQRRLAFSEAGADALLGLEDRLREAQQRRASLVAASKEIEHIDLSRYSEISETVGQMAARLQSDAAQKEQLVAQAKATVASLEAVHGRIERLLSEVRATAQELFEVDTEARVCPVCGAQYRKGELFELVRHEISHVALPELHKAHTELARINEETERLNTTLRDLDVLQSVGHDVIGLASSDAQPVKDLVAALMSLERRIAQCNAELAQIRHDREQLHAKGFTEEELDFLNESLELEFADLPASTKTALEQKRTEIAQKRTFVEARLKACSEEIVTLKTREQALLAQHLGTEEAQPGDATKRFHQISLAVDRLHILLAVVDLNESRPLPEVLLHLNSLRKTVEGYARLRQQEEAVARVIRESEGKIRAAQETLEQKNPIRERLGKAIEVLDGIQTKHGAERYIKDFFDENLQQIGDLFRVIHAPQEFDKIVWVQEDAPGIRAMRKRDSALCRVSNLSSGQRNALSLAIFLTMNRKVRKGPSVIMLDDPVAHVDDLNIVSFFDCLREIHLGSGRQIFFTTASAKTANLFRKKFDYLGADRFREFELPL